MEQKINPSIQEQAQQVVQTLADLTRQLNIPKFEGYPKQNPCDYLRTIKLEKQMKGWSDEITIQCLLKDCLHRDRLKDWVDYQKENNIIDVALFDVIKFFLITCNDPNCLRTYKAALDNLVLTPDIDLITFIRKFIDARQDYFDVLQVERNIPDDAINHLMTEYGFDALVEKIHNNNTKIHLTTLYNQNKLTDVTLLTKYLRTNNALNTLHMTTTTTTNAHNINTFVERDTFIEAITQKITQNLTPITESQKQLTQHVENMQSRIDTTISNMNTQIKTFKAELEQQINQHHTDLTTHLNTQLNSVRTIQSTYKHPHFDTTITNIPTYLHNSSTTPFREGSRRSQFNIHPSREQNISSNSYTRSPSPPYQYPKSPYSSNNHYNNSHTRSPSPTHQHQRQPYPSNNQYNNSHTRSPSPTHQQRPSYNKTHERSSSPTHNYQRPSYPSHNNNNQQQRDRSSSPGGFNSHNRSRTPSPGRRKCNFCDQEHITINCRYLVNEEREIILRRWKENNLRNQKEFNEEHLRTLYNLPKDDQNIYRISKQNKLSHPTNRTCEYCGGGHSHWKCTEYCPLCSKDGHGWSYCEKQSCKALVSERKQRTSHDKIPMKP